MSLPFAAARTLAQSSPRFEAYPGSPNAGGMILTNATNTRALAIGRVLQHFAGTKPVAECESFLDDQTTEAYREAQPDGFFDILAQRNKLWLEWRDEEAEILTTIINERVDRAKRDRSSAPDSSEQRTSA